MSKILILCLFALIACNTYKNPINSSNELSEKQDTVSLSDLVKDIHIIAYDSTQRDMKMFTGSTEYTLSTDEKLFLFKKVDISLNQYDLRDNTSHKHVKLIDYYVQMFARISEKGEKISFVNLICKSYIDKRQLKLNELINAKGGGICFIRMIVNLDTNSFD